MKVFCQVISTELVNLANFICHKNKIYEGVFLNYHGNILK